MIWFESSATITNKDNKIITHPHLHANYLQREEMRVLRWMEAHGYPGRIIKLKGRRQGSSTGTLANMAHTLRRKPTGAFICGLDHDKNVKVMEDILARFIETDRHPWGVTFKRLKGKGGSFSNGSALTLYSANTTTSGRGGGAQFGMFTEVAFYPTTEGRNESDLFVALFQLVPREPGTVIVLESTPNGEGGKFHSTWLGAITWEELQAGKIPKDWNGFVKIFQAWHEFPDYILADTHEKTKWVLLDIQNGALSEEEKQLVSDYHLPPGRLAWRRDVLASAEFEGDEELFSQEYPKDEVTCLTRETRIGTSRGMARISEVEVGSRCDHGVIAKKWQSGVKPVYRVTTRDGYSVRATGDHLFAVADGFVPAGDLVGKHITLQCPVLADDYYTHHWTGFAGVEHYLKITEEWGAFLGYFAGDGSYGGEVLSMVMDKRDGDVVDGVIRLVSLVVGRTPPQRLIGEKKGAIEVRISDKRFREVFEQLGILRQSECITNGAKVKALKRIICIPECIWMSPKPVVRQFLSYLFEADGWASTTASVVKFFTKHLDFARDIQMLLLAFGIQSRIKSVTKTMGEKKFPGIEMALSSVDSGKFMREIGFVSERKKAGKAMSHKPTPRIAARYAPYDEVVSVEPEGFEEVWDIQIDAGEPVFSANGILVHNCFKGSGAKYFDWQRLRDMKAHCRPGEHGVCDWIDGSRETEATFIPQEERESWLRIWERPKHGFSYILIVDPMTGEQANGKEPDNHAPGVWRTGYFDLHARWQPPALVARLADCNAEMRAQRNAVACRWYLDVLEERIARLAKLYGNCPVVVEMNKDLGLVELMKVRGNMNIYRRQEFNKRDNETKDVYGWNTTQGNRKAILETLRPVIRQYKAPGDRTEEFSGKGCDIWDVRVVTELEQIVEKENGRVEAGAASHDDTVLMLAIAKAVEGKAMQYVDRQAMLDVWEDAPQRRGRQDSTWG